VKWKWRRGIRALPPQRLADPLAGAGLAGGEGGVFHGGKRRILYCGQAEFHQPTAEFGPACPPLIAKIVDRI